MPARPIYYDTETTGLSAENERIIEIAAYDPVQGREFCEFVNPGRPIPAEVTGITNITDAMVADAEGFAAVGPRFVEFCEGDVILVAHNNDNFDIHFLRHEFQRNDLELPDWRFVDTLKWARRYRRDLPKHSLQFLREIYGFSANQAHRALDDVIMLHQIFISMTDDLDIEQVYQLLQQEAETAGDTGQSKTMPFGKHRGQPLAKVPKSYVSWLARDGAFEKPENAELKAAFEELGLLEVTVG